MSHVKGMRYYSHNNCPDCDAIDYRLEGRVDQSSSWEIIGEGDLPSKNERLSRNSRGNPITSTYESGDLSRSFDEMNFPSNTGVFLEYRVTFFNVRDPSRASLQFAEIELPGLLK